jgi:Tfp pilus assembly protein PilF
MRVLYAVEAGLPPGFAASHAHNIVLQIGGEMGVIGLALVLWCAMLLLRTFIRTWTSVSSTTQVHLSGYAAVFMASAVHHFLQFAFDLPTYTLGFFLFLAFLTHYAPDQEKISVNSKHVVLLLALLLLIYLLGNVFTLRGSTEFQKGIDAARQDQWERAADHICSAHDTNPYISHYAFQCGLAQAQVASQRDDPDALASAITAFERGLELDPYWPINRANLAALEWTHGDEALAIQHMREALEAAPQNAILSLNLGWMEEMQGENQQAQDHYQHALSTSSSLEHRIFFTQTELRAETLANFTPEINPASANSLAWAGHRSLNDGDLLQAKEHLNNAISILSTTTNAYAWLGRVHLEQGSLELANDNIEIALLLGNNSPIVRTEASRIALGMGDEEAWMDHLLRAYELMRYPNQSIEFASVFYMRPLLPSDLVPQVIYPSLDDHTLQDLLDLASYLKSHGPSEPSEEILTWIDTEINQGLGED